MIERSHDQHFYVEGTINGHPVTFLVDTGASTVAVSEDLARKIDLSSGSPTIFNTFGGAITGRVVRDAIVQVGGVRISGIRIGTSASAKQALLGQNFLKKVELLQDADRMILRANAEIAR